MYLKDRADSEGRCWPAIRTIALELGLSRSTVKRALDDLCRAGLLQKDPRWRENGSLTSNLYHVVRRRCPMLVEIDLLDYLAYQMGCGVLSDLRLSQQSEQLHRLTAAIPLGACSEWEWLDAAQYLTGHDCASALEARNRLVR